VEGVCKLAAGLTFTVIFLIGFVIIFAVLTLLTVLFIAPFAQALTPHLLS
jgi:hypothetical protein